MIDFWIFHGDTLVPQGSTTAWSASQNSTCRLKQGFGHSIHRDGSRRWPPAGHHGDLPEERQMEGQALAAIDPKSEPQIAMKRTLQLGSESRIKSNLGFGIEFDIPVRSHPDETSRCVTPPSPPRMRSTNKAAEAGTQCQGWSRPQGWSKNAFEGGRKTPNEATT